MLCTPFSLQSLTHLRITETGNYLPSRNGDADVETGHVDTVVGTGRRSGRLELL